MTRRVLSLILTLCVLASCMSFVAYAEDSGVTFITGITDGVVPSSASGSFYYVNFTEDSFTAEANGLGGKGAGDYYASVDSSKYSTSDTTIMITNVENRF